MIQMRSQVSSTPECYILITLLCLFVGVDSISKVMVALQETNNVVVRCHFCWVPFLRGGIFDKRSVPIVKLCQMSGTNVR